MKEQQGQNFLEAFYYAQNFGQSKTFVVCGDNITIVPT